MDGKVDSSMFLKLPTLTVGCRRLRYVYFIPPSTAFVNLFQHNELAVPLFLATDVLATSTITSDNQPRVHARFAKKGLATKLTFQEGVKLHGIHGISKGVWFYSVQGVMRVAFELLGKEEQLACLTTLQELWKERYNDETLKVSYSVNLENSSTDPDNRDTPANDSNTTLGTQNLGCEDRENQSTSSNITEITIPDIGSTPQEGTHTTEGSQNVGPGNREHVSTSSNMTEITNPHIGSTSKDGTSIQRNNQESNGNPVKKLLEGISLLISGFLVSNQNCSCVQILNAVISILKTESQLLESETDNYSQVGQFPWKLLDEYKRGLLSIVHDNMEISNVSEVLHDLSLDITSRWLGQEFHQMNDTVSQSVETFKADNISCIDNLPPAEQLIDKLFPRSMKILFTMWIGIKNNESQKRVSVTNAVTSCDDENDDSLDSHRESPPQNTGQNFSRYPLVQLILEFANQTLISGVAHVLYSRLIQQ